MLYNDVKYIKIAELHTAIVRNCYFFNIVNDQLLFCWSNSQQYVLALVFITTDVDNIKLLWEYTKNNIGMCFPL